MEEIAEYIQGFGPMAMIVSMVLDIFCQCRRFFAINFLFQQLMDWYLVCGQVLLFLGWLKQLV